MLIDTNVNFGAWPFNLAPNRTAPALARHLAANGVGRALVSPLGAVFQPDPLPANRALFAAVRHTPALVPVPVINLRLAHWREQLAECHAAGAKAVKLLPNFHHYRLTARVLTEFMPALARTGLRLVVNVRYEDERHRYFALHLNGVPRAELAAFLKKFPRHHVLLTGIYRPDLKELAKTCLNFSADISFCEWTETIKDLLTALPARRLMLGTCTPMLSTRGGVDKLRGARIPARARELIGSVNARRFFKL
ncbi:MAG: amidohydrolase family protein [Opitutales bacterium]